MRKPLLREGWLKQRKRKNSNKVQIRKDITFHIYLSDFNYK